MNLFIFSDVSACDVAEFEASLVDDISTPSGSVHESVVDSMSESRVPYPCDGVFGFVEKPTMIFKEPVLPSTSNEAFLTDEMMEGFSDLTQFIFGVD